MVNKLCLFSLAAFMALGTRCNAVDVTFRVRTDRGSLNVDGVRLIMAGIANMINAIDEDDLYYGGRSFTRMVTLVDNVQVIIRLYFFNRVNSISGYCSLNPIWDQVMRGEAMVGPYGEIYLAMARSALEGFYGHVQAVAGSLGIQYFIRRPKAAPSASNNTTMFNHEQIVSLHLDDDPSCWVYSTCLVSGENAALGSYLPSGATLVSGNGMYKLIMQKDCNLVLYDIYSGVYEVKWDSDTQYKALGCYVNLQMDGNLVMVDSGGVNVMWATNKYCQPQPDCIMTSSLVVQDDGNLVIYNTDQRKPIWSIF